MTSANRKRLIAITYPISMVDLRHAGEMGRNRVVQH
jgi:hypothetical protein